MKGGLLRESCVSACASADVSGDLCKYNVCVFFSPGVRAKWQS